MRMTRHAPRSVEHGRVGEFAALGTIALVACLCAAFLTGCATRPAVAPSAGAESFDFGLVGDVPYSEADAAKAFPNLIDDLNRADLAFVVHDGDIKSGATPCTAELFRRCHRQFQTIRHPLIYLFGDNEWSDCDRSGTNGLSPDAALAELRALFCAGDESLGQRRIKLARQSADPRFTAFRENVRWERGGVIFVGLNVPGAANNFGQPEYAERNRANLMWVRDSFALARSQHSRALMILMQANPYFEVARTNKARAGFNDLLALLERETIAFARPVVLVHGDTHYFRIDKPLVSSVSHRRLENFTRVETFGNPDSHWVRATVDPRDPQVFTFRQQIVEKNLVKHGK